MNMAPWRFGQRAIFCFMTALYGCAGPPSLLNTQYEGLISQQNFPSGAIIRPPKGYCVNPDLGQSTETAEFVTLQACSERDGLLAYGVITVSLVADQDISLADATQQFKATNPNAHVSTIYADKRQIFVQNTSHAAQSVSGLQNSLWQGVELRDNHMLIATLHMPADTMFTKNMARMLLSRSLQGVSVHPVGSKRRPSVKPNTSGVPRPKARPVG
ncbi:MAG: hypothetical protein ISQ87_04975 [Rhodobacteraceae bacterium]|nr:hypothetical protein [Paracoccaceae bacterium]MBL6639785.1 hypothetical protein [Paracoccaceae bacterium]MBL6788880.1 hypothetical protein [Paracoccaceae bacterium]MBL6859315.1 hypothetical protein [Paracoccaceae bacterium]